MKSEYRVEQIQRATVNGRSVKLFRAYRRAGKCFVHIGQFSAPVRTANRDLWKIADAV